MNARECVAMILAGGRGERLGALTRYYSKPAVHFGGNCRIIDFTLSNCERSGISAVGVLSQYFSTDLNAYISSFYSSGDCSSRIYTLPSRDDENSYRGTADAVYKNLAFIDKLDPENVLVLAGDHIYEMDYNEMLKLHRESGAAVTIGSTTVPIKEASRFGVISAVKSGRVCRFEEKPQKPKCGLVSMGIYVFKWSVLKDYLIADSQKVLSSKDFGKNILPEMLLAGEPVYTYRFGGYWRDVGTVDSLWEANMDRIGNPSAFRPSRLEHNEDVKFRCMAKGAMVSRSAISENCSIFGKVEHSVISDLVTVGAGTEVRDSVIMPGAYIGNNVKLYNTIVGTNAVIMDNTVIGSDLGAGFFVDRKVCSKGVSLVAPWLYIPEGLMFQGNSHIYKERMREWAPDMYVPAWSGKYRSDDKYASAYYSRHASFA